MSPSRATQEKLIHANGYHLAVAIGPIAEAVARIRAAGNENYECAKIDLSN
jgi:hypothetical protein